MLDVHLGENILDAGCGNGFFRWRIAKIAKYTGIDLNINDKLVKQSNNSLAFVKGDIHQMPFKNGIFDKVILSSVLQMVKSDTQVLRECNRVMKNQGVIVLSVPTKYLFFSYLNKHRYDIWGLFNAKGKLFYTVQDISALLESNNFTVTNLSYAPRKIGSFGYEFFLFLCFKLSLPLSHKSYFFLVMPFMLLDYVLLKNSEGCELIVRAEKRVA